MPSIIAKLIGDGKSFDKTVAGAQGKLGGLKKSFSGLKSLLGTLGLAAFAKGLIDSGSHLTDVADKLGVTTNFLQRFNFMARESGIANNASEMGLQRFIRRLGEAQQGMGELLPTLTQYNIDLFDSAGKTRSAEEVLADYADTIKNTEDPQERLRLAFKAFDSEGAALVTVLEQGSAGMARMGTQAEKLGQVIGDEQLRRMDLYADRIERIKVSSTTLGTELLGRTIGAIESFGKAITGIFVGTEEGLINKGFRDAAESALRFNDEVVKVNKSVFAGQGSVTVAEEFVRQGERLVPLQEAITAKAEEMRASADANAKAMEMQLESAKGIEATEARVAPSRNKQVELAKELAAAFGDIDDKSEKLAMQEVKRTAELEKQGSALEAQRTALEGLKRQSSDFREVGQFTATFQDIVSGKVGNDSLRNDIEFTQRKTDQATDALFRFGKDSEQFKNAQKRALAAQSDLQERGVDLENNPFKESIEEQTKELLGGILKL